MQTGQKVCSTAPGGKSAASGAELCGWAEKCVRQQRNPAAGGFDNKKDRPGEA